MKKRGENVDIFFSWTFRDDSTEIPEMMRFPSLVSQSHTHIVHRLDKKGDVKKLEEMDLSLYEAVYCTTVWGVLWFGGCSLTYVSHAQTVIHRVKRDRCSSLLLHSLTTAATEIMVRLFRKGRPVLHFLGRKRIAFCYALLKGTEWEEAESEGTFPMNRPVATDPHDLNDEERKKEQREENREKKRVELVEWENTE